LLPSPTPCQRRAPPAPVPVARLGDALFPRTRAAVIRRWRYARSTAHLATRRQRAPAQTCHDQPPRPIAPEALQRPHRTPLRAGGVLRAVPPRPALRFHRRHRLTPKRVRRRPPQHTATPATRHGRALPPPPCVAWRGPRGDARQPSPLAPASALEAGWRTGPCLRHRFQGTVPRALVLGLERGPMAHLPHATVALVSAPQPGQEWAHVHPSTLGATLATLDRKGGGIHHRGGEPVRRHKAMPPATCTARCRAAHHWGGCRATTASFGLGHRVEPARLVTRGDTPCARLLTIARGATERPSLFTPCTGEKQHRRRGVRCGIRLVVGCCGQHGLSPPW
jgi:hypothetical protein